jgi:hypothetical protein
MSVILNEEWKKPVQLGGFCLRACLVKDRKTLILERLEKAVAKLKEARREIRKSVQLTLEMKGDGDDIADQVMAAVAEAFAGENIF